MSMSDKSVWKILKREEDAAVSVDSSHFSSEEHSEPSQTSKIEFFTKTVSDWKPLTGDLAASWRFLGWMFEKSAGVMDLNQPRHYA